MYCVCYFLLGRFHLFQQNSSEFRELQPCPRNLLPCYVRLLQIFELSEYFGTLLFTVFGMAQDTSLDAGDRSGANVNLGFC